MIVLSGDCPTLCYSLASGRVPCPSCVHDRPVQLCRLFTAQLYGTIHGDHVSNDPVCHSGLAYAGDFLKSFIDLGIL